MLGLTLVLRLRFVFSCLSFIVGMPWPMQPMMQFPPAQQQPFGDGVAMMGTSFMTSVTVHACMCIIYIYKCLYMHACT